MKTLIPILLLLCCHISAEDNTSDAKENKIISIDKQKILKLIKQLGAKHFKARKAAKSELIKLDYRAVPMLKEKLQSSKDPEVSESLKEVILKLTFRLHIKELTPKEKILAQIKFTTAQANDHEAQAKVFTSNGCMVLDINSIRIVIDQKVEGLTRKHGFNISTNGKGGGSSSAGSLKIYIYTHRNGTGYWTICGEDLTISDNKISMFGKTLKLNETFKQILFIKKDRTVKGILDLK